MNGPNVRKLAENKVCADRDRYREALEGIVAIGTTPRDSMLSMSGQFYERGQEMLNVATAALNHSERSPDGPRKEPT